jgi:hypothetical protein
MAAQWTELHRRAKSLEARLESKVQRYASLAQKISADFLCDEGHDFQHFLQRYDSSTLFTINRKPSTRE